MSDQPTPTLMLPLIGGIGGALFVAIALRVFMPEMGWDNILPLAILFGAIDYFVLRWVLSRRGRE